MTPLPFSSITKVFLSRIVPIPNAFITKLRITELFYYGLLLPNVTHSSDSLKQNWPYVETILWYEFSFGLLLPSSDMKKAYYINWTALNWKIGLGNTTTVNAFVFNHPVFTTFEVRMVLLWPYEKRFTWFDVWGNVVWIKNSNRLNRRSSAEILIKFSNFINQVAGMLNPFIEILS